MKLLSIQQTSFPDGSTTKYTFGMMQKPDVKNMSEQMKQSIFKAAGENWRKMLKEKSA